MAARLEIEIGGTDKGGNSELKETLGLIEQLKQVQAGLNLDLFKAETVQEIREVGERLTGVNVRIGEYLNLASKATQAWRDNQTDLILDNLATRLSVVQANADAFGQTVQTQNSTLKAYQQAFDALVKNGVDPADKELVNIKNNIEALTASLGANKVALAEQKAYDDLSTKLKQISTDTRLMGDAQKSAEASIRANQAAITALIKAGVDPADQRIKDLQKTISELNETSRQAGFQKLQQDIAGTVGIIGSLEAKAQRLRDALRQATTVDKVEQLQRRLNDVNAELNRLGVNTDRFGKGMGQASGAANAFGTEIARIVQDAPYATKALGAIQNNFGAIGNNITRATELWGGYIAAARATVVANGQVATSSNVAREALRSLTAGMTPYLLAISLVTSAIQVWTALSQKRQRELEKEKDKVKSLAEQTEEYIKTLDALNKISAQTASNFSKEITVLDTLYRTINNNTVARRQQQNALEELQRLYPDVFANLSLEEVQAGKTSEAYRQLAENIRQVAYLEAARSLGAKATEDALKAAVAQNAAYEKAQKAIKEYEEIRARSNRETGFVESNAAYEAAQALVEESNKLGEAYKVATKEAEAYYKAAEQFGGIAREQSGLIYDLEKKIKSLQQARPFLKTKEDLEANTKEINKIQTELDKLGGGSRVKIPSVNGIKDDAEKAAKTVKKLGDAITKIYDPDTDSGNLIGLEALERANQATENKYRELQRKVDSIEREKLEYYKNQLKQKPKLEQEINAEVNKIAGQAAAERKQIEEGRQREIDANREKFAEESAAKIAELEARAGRDRIRSREQEIAADKVYWDAVERNAEKYGITAQQLTEWRKQSEAQINNKWDAKMVQDSFLYQRRLNEGMSQTLLRRLNEETEAKVKAAKGDAAKLLEIERDYQEKVGALQERDRQVKITQSFDGTFSSEPLAKLIAELDLLKLKLDQGTLSAEEFRAKVASLETQRAQLQLWQGTIDNISGAFGNFVGDVFTDTENAMENLGKTFKNVANSIIADLIKIALRQAINAALGKSANVAAVATAQASGRAIAAAYSGAATLASIASFGAAAAVGTGSVLAALGIVKGASVAGFATGGYTGNRGRREIAGVVHGQEFVVNATATRDNLPLLRALNAGRDVSGMVADRARSVNFGQVGADRETAQTVYIKGALANNTIKLSNTRATKETKRFGRG